jgi:7-cyano-7-deazaguanine reductase
MGTNEPLPGRETGSVSTYTPDLLCPIARRPKRDEIHLPGALPFRGCDIWNAYELSWLHPSGKPEVAIGEFRVPCDSEHLVESKSFKLYLNSFSQSKFESREEVRATLMKDLARATGSVVDVLLVLPERFPGQRVSEFSGVCLDDLKVGIDRYVVCPDFLTAGGEVVEEALYSHLLKSNCPVTGQPDWGSVWFHYVGRRMDREGLLKYVISFREHGEFHEHCVERMFVDVLRRCQPERLTVYARYTRRGGLDINPFRSDWEEAPENVRLARQ